KRYLRSVNRVPLDRPIFVLGTQGSGGTIVGRCLRRSPSVVSCSGNSDYWTGTDEMATVRNRMARLPVSLWGSKHRADVDSTVFAADQLYAANELLPAYRRTAADATRTDSARFARILREHLAVYAHDSGHARFVDKTHAYTVK